jgi:hypothetical protein
MLSRFRMSIATSSARTITWSFGVRRSWGVRSSRTTSVISLHCMNAGWPTMRMHAGLLLVSSQRYPRAKKTIGLWVAGLDSFLQAEGAKSHENLCVWLP